MNTTTVSTKYQIVIPKRIRDLLRIRSGLKMQVLANKDRIELIPLPSISLSRGLLPGLDTSIEREEDRQ